MKKLFLMAMAAIMLFSVSSGQVTSKQNPDIFVSPGVSYSAGAVYYNGEIGIAYPKLWLSAGYTYAPIAKQHTVGINMYNKLISEYKASVFVINSAKVNMNTRYLFYEPGISVLYDLTKNISPQFTASVPVVPNTSISYSVSLMYTF
jgi:hypothetical protein